MSYSIEVSVRPWDIFREWGTFSVNMGLDQETWQTEHSNRNCGDFACVYVVVSKLSNNN